jgi:hypothetical protein
LRSLNSDMKIADIRSLSWDNGFNDLDFNSEASTLERSIRRKRQTQSTYGGVANLPTSFVVTLPQSCCTNVLSATDNLQNLCKY